MIDEGAPSPAPSLSDEARSLLAQLLAREDVFDATIERDGTLYVASASGRDREGLELFRLSREQTPEEALLVLLAGYRLSDRLRGDRTSPYDRHLRVVKEKKNA